MEQTLPDTDFDLKHKDHYTLYVLLKDKTAFESALRKNGIVWHSDFSNQDNIDGGIRYFLPEADMHQIDRIIIENGIVASKETPLITEYTNRKKTMKIYLTVAVAVLVLLLLMVLIEFLLY